MVAADYRQESTDVYSHASQEAFVSGCEHGGGSEGTCRCAFTWIKANVSKADFKAYIHLVTSPSYTASQTPPWVFTAVESCLGR